MVKYEMEACLLRLKTVYIQFVSNHCYAIHEIINCWISLKPFSFIISLFQVQRILQYWGRNQWSNSVDNSGSYTVHGRNTVEWLAKRWSFFFFLINLVEAPSVEVAQVYLLSSKLFIWFLLVLVWRVLVLLFFC